MTDTPDDRKQKDKDLYDHWKSTGSKQALGNLIEQMSPLIFNEVRSASGTLPTAALSAEAKKWTIKAIQTYDPDRGAALATHVVNYLQKTRRMNARFQNAVRLPENEHYKFNEYNRTLTDLTDELNREPTDEELANKLGWSKPHVVKFKNSLYADLVESASAQPAEFTKFNEQTAMVQHLMDSLSSDEKFILENSKILSSAKISEKLGININRLNYLKSKLTVKIKNTQHEVGL